MSPCAAFAKGYKTGVPTYALGARSQVSAHGELRLQGELLRGVGVFSPLLLQDTSKIDLAVAAVGSFVLIHPHHGSVYSYKVLVTICGEFSPARHCVPIAVRHRATRSMAANTSAFTHR
jgi:hypothetical protein